MNTVFFDVDTQIDFLFPAGALYVSGAERILPAISQLNRYAATHSIPLVSTMDAHAEDDPEFQEWPPHCVAGTVGQQKPASTLLDKPLVLPSTKVDFKLEGVEQIVLEKQTLDCFSNQNMEALLNRLNADCFVVYGVVAEICVRFAAFGLLKTGRRVEIVTDAIQGLKKEDADRTLAEFTGAGGCLTTAALRQTSRL